MTPIATMCYNGQCVCVTIVWFSLLPHALVMYQRPHKGRKGHVRGMVRVRVSGMGGVKLGVGVLLGYHLYQAQ